MRQNQKSSLKSPYENMGFFALKRRSFKKHFRKLVSLVLVFTFSYSQLLWAADVRQMLLDAKASFEDDTRRGGTMTATDLEAAQSSQISAVDQQNALQDLQNMNFSLTTKNGDILKYVGDALQEVQRPDGTELKNIQLDSNGNILNADLKLSDGSIQVFQNGQVLGYQTPDGTSVEYDIATGRVLKTISAKGLISNYSYETDSSGNVTKTIISSTNATAAYDLTGTLEKLVTSDGITTFFSQGKILKVLKGGHEYLYQSQPLGNGNTKLTLEGGMGSPIPGDANGDGVVDAGDYTTWADQYGKTGPGLSGDFNHDGIVDAGDYTIWADHYAPPLNSPQTHPKELIYTPDNKLKEALLPDNTRLFFENGLLKEARNQSGEITSFSFSESFLGNIVESKIIQTDFESSYYSNGHLKSVKVDDLTIHYKRDETTIDYIEKSDGTELYDLTFDANGNIQNVTIYTPEGEIRTYENGKLVVLRQPDTTELFYFDDKPLKLVTPEKLTYNFNYTPTLVEATLDASNVPDSLTAIKMQYDQNFNLKSVIRQNQEILNYSTNGSLASIGSADTSKAPQVFHYKTDGKTIDYIEQGNIQTFYDANNQSTSSVISPTTDNPHRLDVSYQYGKIREIKKDGVLTFKYTYTFDSSEELTHIEDLEEKTSKVYKEGLLLTNLDQETSVLSTYEYEPVILTLEPFDYAQGRLREGEGSQSGDSSASPQNDARVSKVTVTRLGRPLHTYEYAYDNDDTLVTDEEGIIRTYSMDKKLLFLEKDKQKFQYGYFTNPDGEEIVNEELIEQKLSDGSVAHYDKGQVVRIDLTDGSFITDIVLDQNRSVQKAALNLPDGTRKIFDGQNILEEIAPDNTHFYFEAGRLSKAVDPQGKALLYSYEKDPAGGPDFVWIEKDDLRFKYSPSGTLLGMKPEGVPDGIQGSKEFFDSSLSPKIIEVHGDTHLDASKARFGAASAFFDGSGDYLTVADSPDWDLGSGDFTIDFRFKYASVGYQNVLDFGGLNWGIELQGSAGKPNFQIAGGDYTPDAATTFNAGTWYHLAITRSGTALRFFIDGTQLGSTLTNSTDLTGTGILSVGARVGGNSAFNGWLDELRISKGIARWTSNFAPSTQAYQADSYTGLLLHYDGTDKSYLDFGSSSTGYSLEGNAGQILYDLSGHLTSLSVNNQNTGAFWFADSSQSAHTATPSGDAHLGSDARLGSFSGLFDGQGDNLVLPDSEDWDFGTGDFTVETWIKLNSTQTNAPLSRSNASWGLEYISPGYLNWTSGGLDIKTEVWQPQADTWYHVAVTRSGSQLRFFINGQPLGAATQNQTDISYSAPLYIGSHPSVGYYLNGQLDELRISKGIARWTSGFVPSGEPYTADSYTTLLLHFENEATLKITAAAASLDGQILPLLQTPYLSKLSVSSSGVGALFAATQDSILEFQTIVSQEYSSSGILETQSKVDGTVTLFDDNNRPTEVLDNSGVILIQYSYDAEGHPTRVYLKNARDTLPDEVLKAKQSIEEGRASSLLTLAQQKSLAYQSIQSQVAAQKQALQSQLNSLQDQFNQVGNTPASGKKAKSARGDVLNQIGSAMDQVRGALANLSSQEADAYAALDSQVKSVSDQIEADSQTAFTALTVQEANLKKEILRQEVSPVVYDYYRRILGRDPSSIEYDSWISKTDYNSGGTLSETNVLIEQPSVDPKTMAFQESQGQVFIEAENYHALAVKSGRTWAISSQDPAFSSSYAVTAQGSSYYDSAGIDANSTRLDYKIQINAPGTYYLWVRGYAIDGNSDSLHAGIDGVISDTAPGYRISNFSYGQYSWSKRNMQSQNMAFTINTTGEHTLSFWIREVGFKFDKFILTQDPNFTPSSFGPNESQRIPAPPTTISKPLTQALKDYLNALPELQERQVYVNTVKQSVTAQINSFLVMSQSQKEAFASSLGLSVSDLINLSASDAQKILTWLNGRSLHFGQSAFLALESLLDQNSISYTRTDIAQKAILIDVLTGVISPLDDGDLVISLYALNKVASLYGLTLQGANLSWENLQAVVPQQGAINTPRIIAHINGNHYVVITGITGDTITYVDPGAGPDKNNQIQTISKASFLKGWKGNVTAASALLNPVITASAQKLVPTARLLNKDETQKIRGAFFFFLIPLFISFAASIGGAVASVIAGIGTILAGVGALVGGALSSIGGFLATVAQGIGYIGSAIWQGISFAASSLFGALGNVGSFLSQSVFGSFLKVGFGHTIFQNAVSIGLNFAVSRGLEALGVNPTITNLVSAFVTGGTLGGFNAGLSASSFIQGGIKALALEGSRTLLQNVGLDANLSAVLSLASGQFVGGILEGNLGGQLVKIGQNLATGLSFYGIQKLGDSLGIDPRVSTLIGSPISGVIGAGLQGGANVGTNIINAVRDGISRGVSNLVINYAGQSLNLSPLVQGLTANALTGALLGAFQYGGNFLRGAFESFFRSAANVLTLDGNIDPNDPSYSYLQTRYLAEVLDFSSMVREKGLVATLESHTAQVFQRDAVENIFKEGGIQAFITNKARSVQIDGITLTKLQASPGNIVYLDPATDNIKGRIIGNTEEWGRFGFDKAGNFKLIDGKITNHELDGSMTIQTLQNGNLVLLQYKQNGSIVTEIRPPTGKDRIVINPDGSIRDGVIKFFGQAVEFTFQNGQAASLNIASQGPDGLNLSNEFIDQLELLSEDQFILPSEQRLAAQNKFNEFLNQEIRPLLLQDLTADQVNNLFSQIQTSGNRIIDDPLNYNAEAARLTAEATVPVGAIENFADLGAKIQQKALEWGLRLDLDGHPILGFATYFLGDQIGDVLKVGEGTAQAMNDFQNGRIGHGLLGILSDVGRASIIGGAAAKLGKATLLMGTAGYVDTSIATKGFNAIKRLFRIGDEILESSSQAGLKASRGVAESFSSLNFKSRILETDEIWYRTVGTRSSEVSHWYGKVKPSSATEAEELYNLAKWGNDRTEVLEVIIPKGTRVFEGPVSGGNGFQVFIENYRKAVSDGLRTIRREPLA